MRGGAFWVSRGVFDHPLFRGQEFSEREAWLWLIAEAAWKPGRQRVGRTLVTVERGQIAHSLRFMAGAWGWSLDRTRRFINLLLAEKMLETGSQTKRQQGVRHLSRHLTICNYEQYQPRGNAEPNTSEAKTNTNYKKEDPAAAPAGVLPVAKTTASQVWRIIGQIQVVVATPHEELR
jgi:hypothetical protein